MWTARIEQPTGSEVSRQGSLPDLWTSAGSCQTASCKGRLVTGDSSTFKPFVATGYGLKLDGPVVHIVFFVINFGGP